MHMHSPSPSFTTFAVVVPSTYTMDTMLACDETVNDAMNPGGAFDDALPVSSKKSKAEWREDKETRHKEKDAKRAIKEADKDAKRAHKQER